MVLDKCPNCHEWFDVKYGWSWRQETRDNHNVPHNVFCSIKCMAHYTQNRSNVRPLGDK